MNVSLTPQLERLVQRKVKSGAYQSASEVVRAGLRMLQEYDERRESQLAVLRSEVQIGLDQIKRGEATTVGVDEIPKYMESLKSRARARTRSRQKSL